MDENEELVKLLEERPGLSLNKISLKYPTPFDLKKEWDLIAQLLNRKGRKRGNLTSFTARRKWSDLKYRIHKKFKTLEKLKIQKITRIPEKLKLTALDKRILALYPVPHSKKNKRMIKKVSQSTKKLFSNGDAAPDEMENTNGSCTSLNPTLSTYQRSKLELRKKELLLKKEELKFEKLRLNLMEKQIDVQNQTLNTLKHIATIISKSPKV